MNEKQQQLLDYIAQNKLSPLAASMYVKHNTDYSAADRSSVLKQISDQQAHEAARAKDKEFENRVSQRQKQVEERQAKIDAMPDDLSAGRASLEAAKGMYDKTGGLSAVLAPASPAGIIGNFYNQDYFQKAKEYDDLRRESIDILKQEGRTDLASAIKMPSYGSLEVVDDMLTATFSSLGTGFAGLAVDALESTRQTLGFEPSETLEQIGDDLTKITNTTEQARDFLNYSQGAPERLTDLTFSNALPAVLGLGVREVPHLIMSIAAGMATGGGSTIVQGGSLGARALSYGRRFLKMQKTAPAVLNMMTRGSSTYQRIANDPNLSNAQKYTHSALMGVVEGAGDSFLAAAFGLSGVGSKAATSTVGQILARNAVARSTAQFIGATSGEAVTEIAQELAAIQSERNILGKEVSGGEVLARIKEAGIGGALMGGAFRVAGAPYRAAVNIAMMGDRPGDITHKEATELHQRAQELINKALSEDLTDSEIAKIDSEIKNIRDRQDKIAASRNRVYRVLRRRDGDGFNRVLEIDSEINKRLVQIDGTKEDSQRKIIKGEMEALIEERQKITSKYEGEENQLTLLEKFEDALEDVDQAIQDTVDDFESINGVEIKTEADEEAVLYLGQRLSALKNKRNELRREYYRASAAEGAGNVEGVAQAAARMEEIATQSLPREEGLPRAQVEDDANQDQEEVTQQRTEEQEEETTEERTEEQVLEKAIILNSPQDLTDAVANRIPTNFVSLLRNLLKALDVEVIIHENQAALVQAHPQKLSTSRAFYLPSRKQIHISKESTNAVIKHEFVHAMIHDLVQDGRVMNRVIQEIEKEWDPKKIEAIRRTYSKESQQVQDEEVIVGFMVEIANEDGLRRLDRQRTGFVQRIINFFNSLIRAKHGAYAENYLINNETDLRGMAEAFAAGAETGSKINVDTNLSSTESSVRNSLKSRAYPDLIDKEITFLFLNVDKFGIARSTSRKTMKFRDYWHWRNYWAAMTGNGKHDYIAKAQYIGADGKVKDIKTPTPKKDKQGNIIDMRPRLYSMYQRNLYSQTAYSKHAPKLTTELDAIQMLQAKLPAGFDLTEAEQQRLSDVKQALLEMNELVRKKDPNEDNYIAVIDRLAEKSGSRVGPLGDTVADETAVDNFMDSVQPDPEADFDNDVSGEQVLNAVEDPVSAGVPLKWSKTTNQVKSLREHLGRFFIAIQYDKTSRSSGVGTENVDGAVSSHASRSHADKMVKALEKAIRKEAERVNDGTGDIQTVMTLVAFSLQADSIMSNPRAIDMISKAVNALEGLALKRFATAFEQEALAAFTEGAKAAPQTANNYTFRAIRTAIERSYGGATESNVRSGTGLGVHAVVDKDGNVFGFPKFSKMSEADMKSSLANFIQAFQVDGEGKFVDGSIRSNAAFIKRVFGTKTSSAKALGVSYVDIREKLEASKFKDVGAAHVVAYREVPAKVRFREGMPPEILTNFEVKQVKGKAFKYTIVSSEGTDFFGMNQSLPLGRMAMSSQATKDSDETIGEMIERKESISKEGKKAEAKAREEIMEKQSDISRKMKAVREVAEREGRELNEEERRIMEEYSKENAELMQDFEEMRDTRKKAERGISETLSGVAQGIFTGEVDLNEEVLNSIDPEEALNSLNNNSWAPRSRTAIQQKVDWFRLKFADKFAPIMMMQEDIEAARGKRVEGDQNFKRAEELMYGKAHYDLEQLEKVVTRLKDSMKNKDVKIEDLNDFMYARHAAERNAMLKERDGVENGSGLTDQEAAGILAAFSKEETAALEEAAAIVDEISQTTRDTMRKFGLESDTRIDAFEKMFKNYVPLAGVATDSQDVDNYPYPTGGIGFHVKGSTTKKAGGRKTKAENIVAQVIQQSGAVTIKARRNEALQSLYKLAEGNPNTNLWNVSDNVPVTNADRAVGVRINGEQKFIIFKDESLASNLKGMGVQKMDALSKLMAAPANFLRVAFTTRNPEFIVGNFSRDILSAIPNAIAEAELADGAIKGKHSVARKIIQRVPSTLKALLKSDVMGKDLDPVIAKYLDEFKADGGQTGWGFVKPLQDIAAELDLETNEGNKAKKAIKWMEQNSLQHIENVNDAFENSIRLSSYIEAREAGVSREDAAQLAKNITVNFNKSGEYGAVANAYYLFFNASIQGSVRLFRSLGKLKTVENVDGTFSKELSTPQKIMMGLALTSGLVAMLNMAMSDEDEDGELFYNKIPDYEKERNLIMMYDGKNYIKIPLPYGYNVFSNFGTALAETMAGERDADDAMWFVANSAFSSFSPVSFGQSENFAKYIAKGAAPTVFKPLVEMAVNETYFGSRVYQTQFPVGAKRPEAELAFRSPRAIKSMFQWLNEATGGSKQVSGSVDVNPDLFWYPFEYYIGGLGQFGIRGAESTYAIGQMITQGEKVEMQANDIPFLRKVYGEPSRYYDFDLYDANKSEIMQLYKELKKGKVDEPGRYKGVARLDKKMKAVEKTLKLLRAKRRTLDSLPYIERVNETARLQERERKLVMEYNELHERLRK